MKSSGAGHINPLAKKIISSGRSAIAYNTWPSEIKKNNVSILSQAITLIESKSASDRIKAITLLGKCKPNKAGSIRIGITGPPGVGKSSFIESFGINLLDGDTKKIAVLSIDPSSPIKGGSILGDKTRMQTLSQMSGVFVRPSPAGDDLGGVHLRTSECIQLCEYAGYDYILIETVGVGQSELTVKDLTDFTILLISPGGGDELQGIKRGITEIADLIIVNKDDSGLEEAAKTTQHHYQQALNLLADKKIKVMRCSSTYSKGIEPIEAYLTLWINDQKKSGSWYKKRKSQRLKIFKTQTQYAWLSEWHKWSNHKILKSIESKTLEPEQDLNKLSLDYIKKLKNLISQE